MPEKKNFFIKTFQRLVQSIGVMVLSPSHVFVVFLVPVLLSIHLVFFSGLLLQDLKKFYFFSKTLLLCSEVNVLISQYFPISYLSLVDLKTSIQTSNLKLLHIPHTRVLCNIFPSPTHLRFFFINFRFFICHLID